MNLERVLEVTLHLLARSAPGNVYAKAIETDADSLQPVDRLLVFCPAVGILSTLMQQDEHLNGLRTPVFFRSLSH
eukprot:m.305737 g.305737  ORF g.305737 m.305737 type:complete len:75 (-) comp23016_c1_seq4:449-673(-)